MKLIANGLNKQFFSSFLPPPDTEIDGVVAAIAYGDDKIHVSGSVRRKSSLP